MPEVIVEEPRVIRELERAEIDMQIATAKQYPRSIEQFQNKALSLATHSIEIAASCGYTLPRGGKNIDGPSIRLAEIVAGAYGNLRVGSRCTQVLKDEVVVECGAHDLESNYKYTSEIRRRIVNKNGNRFTADMIIVTINAACAIAARNAIFKVVPYALVEPVYKAALKTAVGTQKTLAKRRGEMVEKFGELGVKDVEVFAKIKKASIEEIDLRDLKLLYGIFTSISEGTTTVEFEFRAKGETPKSDMQDPVTREQIDEWKKGVGDNFDLLTPDQKEAVSTGDMNQLDLFNLKNEVEKKVADLEEEKINASE